MFVGGGGEGGQVLSATLIHPWFRLHLVAYSIIHSWVTLKITLYGETLHGWTASLPSPLQTLPVLTTKEGKITLNIICVTLLGNQRTALSSPLVWDQTCQIAIKYKIVKLREKNFLEDMERLKDTFAREIFCHNYWCHNLPMISLFFVISYARRGCNSIKVMSLTKTFFVKRIENEIKNSNWPVPVI